MLKATVGIGGVDTYYIPDDWLDVLAVYVLPGDMDQRKIWRLRKMRKFFLEKYKINFVIMPAEASDKVDPRHRKIKIEKQEGSFYFLADVKMASKEIENAFGISEVKEKILSGKK